jgi:hypothetical protein
MDMLIMFSLKSTSTLLVLTAGLAMSANTLAYTIDGSLSDWGVSQNGNAQDWTPSSGVLFAEEDQHSDYLGPGTGGQGFDAEAIYLDWDSTHLYFAVVTGRSEDQSVYPSGDLAFDFGNNGQFEIGIETRGNNGFNKGDLVAVSDWQIAHPHPEAGPTEINAGALLSSNDLIYSANPVTGIGEWKWDSHFVIEGSVALADFALFAGEDFTVQWTMGCGNDLIALSVDGGLPGTSVPEPAPVLLMAGSLMLLAVMRRRRVAQAFE